MFAAIAFNAAHKILFRLFFHQIHGPIGTAFEAFSLLTLIACKNDSLAPIKHVRDFKKEFAIATRSGCSITTIELPGANHYFYRWSSPRAHSIAYGIEPFLRSNFEKHSLKVKNE